MHYPIPEAAPRRMSVAEFVASEADPALREIYEDLFSVLPLIHPYAKSISGSADSIPQTWIRTNSEVAATEVGDLLNTIFLADGLIKRCLDLNSVAATVVDGQVNIPQPFGASSVAKVCFLWAYGHELFHYLRRHELVQKHFGSDPETALALEYDADMCSTAAIYRCVQQRVSEASALSSKCVVLMNLFWLLRDQSLDDILGRIGKESSHIQPAERLLLIAGKLAMMHDDGVADPGFGRPETLSDHKILIETVAELELLYVDHHLPVGAPRVSPIYQASQLSHKTALSHRIHTRWDQIQLLARGFASISRDKVDNEQSVAFTSHAITTYSVSWEDGPKISWVEVRPFVHLPWNAKARHRT